MKTMSETQAKAWLAYMKTSEAESRLSKKCWALRDKMSKQRKRCAEVGVDVHGWTMMSEWFYVDPAIFTAPNVAPKVGVFDYQGEACMFAVVNGLKLAESKPAA